jgi:hypothetical protein
MKETIYTIIQPGVEQQVVYVFSENSDTIPITLHSPINSLADTILSAAQKYNISEIKIKGVKDFNQKIKDDIFFKKNIYFKHEKDLNVELI